MPPIGLENEFSEWESRLVVEAVCQHSFTSLDLRVGKLIFTAVGCESFPAAPVCLIEGANF
jgi:hypothetical protein